MNDMKDWRQWLQYATTKTMESKLRPRSATSYPIQLKSEENVMYVNMYILSMGQGPRCGHEM